ncbi:MULTISPECIES: hypothetical protein [Amylolactobacillus]|nr:MULTISPECIES: hypothetical protein [Amylolactobacillus]KRM42321.1 hypothetical protein FD40_GL001108 [Amylolactobacillus amylophilus DSM 20533 = JCM 1125]GED80125.1 hypothetical protein LAM01_05980 [Amylolactobacillus amylophilus]
MSDFDRMLDDFFKNYQDRGMKKWAGFYLSDHTQKIEQEEQQNNKVIKSRPIQTAEEVGMLLFQAFENHLEVDIQLKQVDVNGVIPASIVGFVGGYQQDNVVINDQQIKFEDIKNIQIRTE